MTMQDCPLCADAGGEVLWQDHALRVIWIDDADFPGFCRVVWQQHCAELTDLEPEARRTLMDVVALVERNMRAIMRPDKVNLASLGNVVPHLHWHVIPRFRDDSHFPQPIWGERQRVVDPVHLAERRAAAQTLRAALPQALDEARTA